VIQDSTSEQLSHNAFVGRERELAELRAGLGDVIAGRGRLFLMSGEPGIGKTRLAEEISNDASACGIRVLWGRCWEGGGAPAYWPLIQILRAAVGDRVSEQLQTLLGPNATEIARLIPEIKTSLPAPEPPQATTDSESARFLLFDSVATLLKNFARTGSLLVVVDDLHDADQPSLEMLRFIARTIKDVPLLIVGTYREAEVRNSPELGKLLGDLLREGRSLPLVGLSKAEVGELIARRTGRVVDEGLVADLYRATDGNALYVEGVVRLLESYRTAIDRRRFKIPDGVRESIRRQLAALSGEANSLLSIAAVIGTEFDTRLLERVSHCVTEEVVERLDEAIRIGVLRSTAPGFAGQQFSHALIREVLYDDLAANRRFELHRRIGTAIEEQHKEDLKPHLAALAYHFRAGRVAKKAIEYSIAAGEADYRIFAYEEASHSWQAALGLMEEHNIAPESRAPLLERLATLMYITDPSDPKGIEYLARALKIYEELGRTESAALVHSRMGVAFSSRSAGRNPAKAMEHYRKAEVILGKSSDSRRKATLYTGMAMAALQLLCIDDGLAWSRAAMSICERLGNDEIWVNAASAQALLLHRQGRLALAVKLVDEASNRADRLLTAPYAYNPAWNSAEMRLSLLDPTSAPFWLLRELANPRLAHVTTPRLILLGSLLQAYVDSGDLAQARRVWEEEDLSHSVGGVHWLVATGEFERAETSLAQHLERTRSRGTRDEECERTGDLARVRQILGDLEGAEKLGRIAVEMAKPNVIQELWSGSFLARIYGEMGCPGQAPQLLIRCREILGNGEDWRGLAGAVVRAEAVVAAAEGRYQDAEKQFEKAVEIFRRYHVPFEEAEAFYCYGRALYALGQHNRANQKLHAAIAIYRRCGAGEQWLKRAEAARGPAHALRRLSSEGTELQTLEVSEAVFRREGDYWTLTYHGKTSRLKDAKGFHYLANLLARPGKEIRALDLVVLNGGASAEAVEIAQAREVTRSQTVARDLGHAGEVLDAQTKAAYKRRLTELRQKLEDARELGDEEHAGEAEEEINALARELKSAVGLSGRTRRAASSSERARVAVTKAIRFALGKISKNDAELSKLLTATIRTGTVCSYRPPAGFPVRWRL